MNITFRIYILKHCQAVPVEVLCGIQDNFLYMIHVMNIFNNKE